MDFSIIIPVYNEENKITDLLHHLQKGLCSKAADAEIIVVDGGSKDNSVDLAKNTGATCLVSTKKGRAAQMNMGAHHSSGDILYFVHADSFPPKSFINDITDAIHNGFEAGCYRYQFDSNYPLLKINAYCTRFNLMMCRGGDQTLFITRDLFYQLGGFNNEFMIMEDYDLIQRIQAAASFKIIPKNATVSARKYIQNGYFMVQIANLIVFLMYSFDYPQQDIVDTYKQLIYHPKF